MTLDTLHLILTLLLAGLAIVLAVSARRRHQYLRTLDELPVGLCTITSNGQIQLWNSQMDALSNIAGKRGHGGNLSALPANWRDALEDALEKTSGNIIKRAISGSGEGARWIILHSSPRVDVTGARTVLVEDISDYQRLQDELLHKERLASIGRLAAGVAHEIGNPVTGIACLAQNLAELGESQESTQSAEEILKQTGRITRIVNSLVQFSHNGGISEPTDMRPCNLADCVDEAIHLLSLDREATRESFENSCDRETLVMGDNQLLLQVFVNLLDNARAATAPHDPVSVDARVDGDDVIVHIENTGEAIPPDILEHIFEPFFTTKEVGMGTGLGLPLVRGMLQDMEGEIDLLSPRPHPYRDGTRATLRLLRAEYDLEL